MRLPILQRVPDQVAEMKIMASVLFCILAVPCLAATGTATDTEPKCADAKQPMAFWIGEWDVYVDGKVDGHNLIESTLAGCALLEHWDDSSGYKGLGVFYFDAHVHQWKQVWVTDQALLPGGMKEKAMVFASDDTVRFQGTLWLSGDRVVIDRTTLHKLDNGEVEQTVEYSKDGGANWMKAFDGIYRRARKDK